MSEPVNLLEKLMVQAAEDPLVRDEFKEKCLTHMFYLITEKPMEESGGQVALFTNSIEVEGEVYATFFSSEEQMRRFHPNAHFFRMRGRELFKMMMGRPLFLNPGGEFGKLFTPAEMYPVVYRDKWERYGFYTCQDESILVLGQPPQVQESLVEALRAILALFPDVYEAYVAQTHKLLGSFQPFHVVIGIKSRRSIEVVAEAIRRSGLIPEEEDRILDIQVLESDELSGFITQNFHPVYRRKRFWAGWMQWIAGWRKPL